MSETDPKKEPQNEEPDIDDELESLSAEEKAAFDKIMAEISAATGVSPDAGAEEKTGVTKNADAETPVSESPDVAEHLEDKPAIDTGIDVEADAAPAIEADEPEDTLTDSQQAALDAMMSEITAEDDTVEGSTSEEESKTPPDEDSLDADQQAAMDQIMAEIEAKRKSDEPAKIQAENEDAPAQDDDLDPDQQAAMEQIMAEIESKRKGDKAEPAAETNEAPEEDLLDADQQAAMDQIMAEIEAKRKSDGPAKVKAEDADAPPQDDELDPDQQAAMEKIMAEIGAKRKNDLKPAPQNADEDTSDSDEENVSDDDQDAMEKIMAEIEAQKSGKLDNNIVSSKSADSDEDQEGDQASANGRSELTMEEFDDELNNLLSTATAQDGKKDAASSKSGKAMPEDVNATLKAALAKGGTDEGDPPEDDKTAVSPVSNSYPILQEVSDAPDTGKSPSKGMQRLKTRVSVRLVGIGLSIMVTLSILTGAGYWTYRRYIKPAALPPIQDLPGEISEPMDPTAEEPIAPTKAGTDSAPPPLQQNGESPVLTQPQMETALAVSTTQSLAQLMDELESARRQIQGKIRDIEQLKSYYGHGIDEEVSKIEDLLENGQIPSFEQAIADKKIELSLRAIQRRTVYMTKLETPLTQLSAMSEELLFLSRKARTFSVLEKGIIGLPVDTFSRAAENAIQSFLRYNTQLSIDRVSATPPELSDVWSKITSDLSKKANLLAQRKPVNRSISKEICKGNYDRKYLLTAMSVETAKCLVKWSGKDLYLNALDELTPEVAKVLSTWPGEWLSLNGLRELSPDAAAELSKWQGKRLSLNGLTTLNQETTANLSQWHGEQLEMVGLQRIGRWENYGTRLFLSEKLRRRLEEQ